MKATKQQEYSLKSRVWYSLYDRLLHAEVLEEAFKKVKSSNGAPGIDGQSCNGFALNLTDEIAVLLEELRTKTYRPSPVKRVELKKDDGGVRLIGIPTVRDRVVQQALKMAMEPIFEVLFHKGSYGYRPGRSAKQAVAHATELMRERGLEYVVDMDLSKCFDLLDHDLILKAVRRKISDGSILALIGRFLESGVMNNGVLETTETGSPQGGVISPLLANICLNEFDQTMKSRGHEIVRYADDILIFKGSQKGAQNALEVASMVLEKELKLTVNTRKTHLANLEEGVAFLGFIIHRSYIRIKEGKVEKLKEKLKAATRRNVPVNLGKVIRDINPILRGFVNYFKLASCKTILRSLMGWLRRRLRAIQMKLWKKPAKLHRRLRQLGYKGDFKRIRMASWRNASCQLAHMAMPNDWFKEIGLYAFDEIETGKLPRLA
jgi:group II intron reverse transcriptase/maturase